MAATTAPLRRHTFPRSGSMSPASMRNSVVFPEPLRPTRATRAPSGICHDTPSSTSCDPKDLVTSDNCAISMRSPQKNQPGRRGGRPQTQTGEIHPCSDSRTVIGKAVPGQAHRPRRHGSQVDASHTTSRKVVNHQLTVRGAAPPESRGDVESGEGWIRRNGEPTRGTDERHSFCFVEHPITGIKLHGPVTLRKRDNPTRRIRSYPSHLI